MITPRSRNKEGFEDVDREDYEADRDGDPFMIQTQLTQLRIIEDQWTDDYKVRVYKD